MHEHSLMAGLMRQIERVAAAHAGAAVVAVRLRVGALAHISAEHLREHFRHAARGHCAEHARLDVLESVDMADPAAQHIVLESVELAAEDDETR